MYSDIVQRSWVVVLTAVIVALACQLGRAQTVQEIGVVASGSGAASADGITLRGTVAQPATRVMGDAEMRMSGGLWPAAFHESRTPTPIRRDPGGELPSEYDLRAAYPNPFNPVTTIGFAVPEASTVRLVVFDALGRRVRTLVDETRQAGYHETNFDAGELPSGIYYYRFRAGAYHEVKAVTLVK